MSLVAQITALVQRIGTEIKALRSEASASRLYQPTSYLPGKPSANGVLLSAVVGSGVSASFPQHLVGSYATAEIAATAQTICLVKKGTTQVGTITFAASAVTGTFVLTGGMTLAAGDRVTVLAPATPDATLSGINLVLAGTRS